MKFEIGKFYKTRDGHKAQIFMLDNGAGYMMGIAMHANGIWFSNQWRCDGTIYIDSDTPVDLISEWEETKNPRLLAPCLYRECANGRIYVSRVLYSSEAEARDGHNSFIHWPAVPNKDGMYEVME